MTEEGGAKPPNMAALRAAAKFKSSAAHIKAQKKELTLKERVHVLFDEPKSSFAASCVAVLLAVLIVGSSVAFIVETVPSYENWPGWYPLEIAFTAVFSVEILCRWWAFPGSTQEFFSDPLNVVDVVAVAPFYITFFMSGVVDSRVLRVFRLVRTFKLGRHYKPLQLIGETIVRAHQSLALCFFFLLMALMLFGSILWALERGTWHEDRSCYARDVCTTAERGKWDAVRNCHVFTDPQCSPFMSVPQSFWWGITTMSTVGYGDTYPVTSLGRVVAGIAMVSGILCVALPTTVLSVEFSDKYEAMVVDMKRQEQVKHLPFLSKGELKVYDDMQHLSTVETQLRTLLPRLQYLAAKHHAGDSGSARVDADVVLDAAVGRALGGIESLNGAMAHFMPNLVVPRKI